MKTITLHLTFSAVALEILCSLSQLEEKDYVRPQICINPNREGKTRQRGRGVPGKNAVPVPWQGSKGPRDQRCLRAGPGHHGQSHMDAGTPPPRETAMMMVVIIIIITVTATAIPATPHGVSHTSCC